MAAWSLRFVLMGPTWTRDMTSVYLRLDLEKDRIFVQSKTLFVLNIRSTEI